MGMRDDERDEGASGGKARPSDLRDDRWSAERQWARPRALPFADASGSEADDGGASDRGRKTVPEPRPGSDAGQQSGWKLPGLPSPGQWGLAGQETVVSQLQTFVSFIGDLGRRLEVSANYLGAIIDAWTLTLDAFEQKHPAARPAGLGVPGTESGSGAEAAAPGAAPAPSATGDLGRALARLDIGTIIKFLQALEGLRLIMSAPQRSQSGGGKPEGGAV